MFPFDTVLVTGGAGFIGSLAGEGSRAPGDQVRQAQLTLRAALREILGAAGHL